MRAGFERIKIVEQSKAEVLGLESSEQAPNAALSTSCHCGFLHCLTA